MDQSKGKNYFDLTLPQKNIWMLENFISNTPINIISASIIIKQDIEPEILKKTLEYIIDNNDSFRIKLKLRKNLPKVYIEEPGKYNIEFVDFVGKTGAEMEKYLYDISNIPFKLYKNYLYQFIVVRFDTNKYQVYIKAHHLIADAWSLVQLSNFIGQVYTAFIENRQPDIKFNQYFDYIKSEKQYIDSEKYIEDENFWGEELKNISLASIKDEVIVDSFKSKRFAYILDNQQDEKIKKFCLDNKVSVFALFMAVLSIYVHRISGQKTFSIGTPILNRKNFVEKNTLGLFVSTMILKLQIEQDISFKDLIQFISLNSKKCFRHERYPATNILGNLYGENKSREVPYDIILSYQNAKVKRDESTIIDYDVIWNHTPYQHESLILHISSVESTEVLKLYYDYLEEVFNPEEIEILNKRLLGILNQIVTDVDMKISDIEVVTETEKEYLLNNFAAGNDDHNYEINIKEFLEESASLNYEKIALDFKDEKVIYEKLNHDANVIADNLICSGIKPNDIVGVSLRRGPRLIESIIAVVKVGAVFVPIDPEYPINRIDYILNDSKASLIIIDNNNDKNYFDKINTLNIDEIDYSIQVENPEIEISPNDLLYIMYTSGSTGNPKGVMIEHRSVVNYVEAVNKHLDYKNINNVLSVTTMSFDIFIFELFPTLCLGLKLIIADEDEQKMPDKLVELIYTKKVEKIQTTPSRFNMVIDICKDDNMLSSIKEINLGGEPLTEKNLAKIKEHIKANIFNCYGPTETTVYSTFKDQTYDNNITVGKPLNNTYIYIMDNYNKLLPFGEKGEICIGGLGVGRGYLNNETLQNQKFVVNPYNRGVIYKTGDVGRFLPNNELECLGRIDSQVKIKGHRIELKEVETKILQLSMVKEACVVDYKDESKDILIAFLVGTDIDVSEVKKYLNDSLPKYMVPSMLKIVESFPLSYNGKVDKKRLVEMHGQFIRDSEAVDYVAPETETEKILAEIFKEVLNIDKIGIDDNFFEIGGDSLLVIQAQINAFSKMLNYTTQDFYRNPTIRELAKLNDDKETGDNLKASGVSFERIIRKNTIEGLNLKSIDISKKRSIRRVLLTGVTGFLGAHILKSIIDNTDYEVYCLIRSKSLEATQRLENTIINYLGSEYLEYLNTRIICVEGDLEKEKFDLDDDEYEKLGTEIDEIIHAAANVKYYGNYSDFSRTNVDATLGLAEFAIMYNNKLNYISSLGVSGHFLVSHEDKNALFNEKTLYIGQYYEENPYVMSKYMAEEELYRLRDEKNLILSVIRIGNLTGRKEDGTFQKNIAENAFYNILRSIIQIRKVPKTMLDNTIDFTQVDVCADAILEFIKLEDSKDKVVHILNQNTIDMRHLINIITDLGIDIDIVSEEEFGMFAYQLSAEDEKKQMLLGLINDINSKRQVTFNANVKIDSKNSVKLLKKLNIKFSKVNHDYFKKVIDYMRETKYIEGDNMETKLIKNNIFTKIMVPYTFMFALVGAIFYDILPWFLNYPKGTYGTKFQMELEGTLYIYQYIMVMLLTYIITALTFKFLCQKVDNIKIKTQKDKFEFKKALVQLPTRIYLYQIVFPIVSLLIVHPISIKAIDIITIKLVLVLGPMIVFVATLLYLLTKRIVSTILKEHSDGTEEFATKNNALKKGILEFLPIFITLIVLTIMFGYSNYVKERGNLYNQIYKERFEKNFSEKDYSSLEEVNNILNDINKINGIGQTFTYKISDGKYEGFDKDNNLLNDFKLSKYFVKYMKELSESQDGVVYEYYGTNSLAHVNKISINNEPYYVGIKFSSGNWLIVLQLVANFIIATVIYFVVIVDFYGLNRSTFAFLIEKFKSIINRKRADKITNIPIISDDEFGELTYLYNKLNLITEEYIASIEQKQDIITKQAQLASIGELAGGVAHDINTPIATIKSGLLMLKDMYKTRGNEENEVIQRMDNCADKIINIVNSIRNQIRNLGSGQVIEFKIRDVINDVKTIAYNELSKNKCELNVTIEDDLKIKGDPIKLGQVLTNIVVNAVQAYEGRQGKIDVVVMKSPNNMAMVKVIDYANGIKDEIRDHIFKSVLTTKGTTGTGLGLYLAKSIVKADFNGDISFETQKNEGTVFYLNFPIYDGENELDDKSK